MHSTGDVHFRRRLKNRPGHIAARADDDVGLEFCKDMPRLDGRCERQSERAQILRRELPAEPLDLDMVHLIPRCADKFVLDAARRADECNLGGGLVILDYSSNGKCGIDMPACAAARHKYTHIFDLS